MCEKKSYRREWLLLAALGLLAAVVLCAAINARTKLPKLVDRVLTEAERNEVIARNSPLTSYVYLSPMANFPRTDSVRKITIHHMAGDVSLKELGEVYFAGDRQASANYGIDTEGRVGLYVEECNRAWTSSSPENDHQAVTIEVANDETGGDWHVSDASFNTLIELCVDICMRNGIKELVYTGDETGNLTLHSMFTKTECPGPYLTERMADIAAAVNQRLNAGTITPY